MSWIWLCKICQAFTHLSPRFRLQWTKAASSSSRNQTPFKKSQYPVPGILTTLLLGSQRQRPSNQATGQQTGPGKSMHCSWDQNLELEEAVQGREQEGRMLSTLLQLLGAEIKRGNIWAETLAPGAEPVPAIPPGKSSAVKYVLVECHSGKTQSHVLGSENPLQVSKMDPDFLETFRFPLPLGVLVCFGLVLVL